MLDRCQSDSAPPKQFCVCGAAVPQRPQRPGRKTNGGERRGEPKPASPATRPNPSTSPHTQPHRGADLLKEHEAERHQLHLIHPFHPFPLLEGTIGSSTPHLGLPAHQRRPPPPSTITQLGPLRGAVLVPSRCRGRIHHLCGNIRVAALQTRHRCAAPPVLAHASVSPPSL
jgi:hypothetical protein